MLSNLPISDFRILFRADGNKEIGLGHIHRALSFAEMLLPWFTCCFAIRKPLPGIRRLILDAGIELLEVQEVSSYDEEIHTLQTGFGPFDIWVLDGYRFGEGYQKKVKKDGSIVICIDDLHLGHFFADAIVNHAGGVKAEDYSAEPYTTFFLGPEYSLVKPVFLQAATRRVPLEQREQAVFISMGGADTAANHTLSILTILNTERYLNRHCFVVLGEAYPFSEVLDSFIQSSPQKITVLRNLSPTEMLFYMEKCPVAICPPSGVAYEYLCAGGILYLYQTADNQQRVKDYLLKAKLALDFGNFDCTTTDQLDELVQNQGKVFDGLAAARVLGIVKDFYYKKFSLRKVTDADLAILFEWANDPEVRQNAINQEPIALGSHEIWFKNKLRDEHSKIFVLRKDEQPVGQIRFDFVGDRFMIDYSIAPNFRGLGLGSEILKQGLRLLTEQRSEKMVLVGAEVDRQNIPSMKVFRSAGFLEAGERSIGERVFTIFEKKI